MLLLNVNYIIIGRSVILQSNNIILLIILFVVGSILIFSYYYLLGDVAVGVFNIVYMIFIGRIVLLLTSYALVMFLR